MSQRQSDQLGFLLGILRPTGGDAMLPFHHGAAVGADTEAANMARLYGFAPTAHPAENGRELARNREIVAESDILIAAPRNDHEELRSGTWATVRYARQKGIPVVMLSRGR
jgi:hypothetical protein